ncbi:MAG: hypothetical protein LUF84_02430, partial [Clostridiales bacterium]|nr:hypothetical protein [Clostridiales bacterium]
MTEESLILADALPTIRAALEGLDTEVSYTVSAQWPRKVPAGALITVTELDNSQVSGRLVVDRLSYQIDLWGPDADELRTLVPLVNTALLAIGFLREYAGVLGMENGYYRKTFRFGRRVD